MQSLREPVAKITKQKAESAYENTLARLARKDQQRSFFKKEE